MSRVWVFGDLSQAEARVVAWAGPVPGLKWLFQSGQDVHTTVAQQIARVVQDNRIRLPAGLFQRKVWHEFGQGDPERQTAKTTVHALNYGMGVDKFGRITGLPEAWARELQEIYFSLFPEIRSNYHAKIQHAIKTTRTIALPAPFRWHKKFYDMWSPDLERAAFAFLPQSTVGRLLVEIWNRVTGAGAPVIGLYTPEAIVRRGLDARLQNHDEIGVSCEAHDTPDVVERIRDAARIPIVFDDGEQLIIPIDFKVGSTWGDATVWGVPARDPAPQGLDRSLSPLHG